MPRWAPRGLRSTASSSQAVGTSACSTNCAHVLGWIPNICGTETMIAAGVIPLARLFAVRFGALVLDTEIALHTAAPGAALCLHITHLRARLRELDLTLREFWTQATRLHYFER